MTVNYYVECPVCHTVTRMRSPAGYVYSTPVRVHCGKCQTLLFGEFISDNEHLKAYFKPQNCKTVNKGKYEYRAEASGEIICGKMVAEEGDVSRPCLTAVSPVLSFLQSMSMENKDAFIDYVCYASDLSDNMDKARIKYDLYLNEQFELLKKHFGHIASTCGYNLYDNDELFQYIYYSLFFDCAGLFKEVELKKLLTEINYKIYHLDIKNINDYLRYLEQNNRLDEIESKLFELVRLYLSIFKFLAPAVGLFYYDDASRINKETQGISTCSFNDIKNFYLDAFEILADCCDIVIGLDNIDKRFNYNAFTNRIDMIKFRNQTKGVRIKNLSLDEFFAARFNLKTDSNELRNAVGHNNFEYNGITQKLSFATAKGENKSAYLIDVALECVSLSRSAYVLLFYVYELKRYCFLQKGKRLLLNPLFYRLAKPQNHCPCGSGAKYRNCCKNDVEKRKKIKMMRYPKMSS